MSRRREVATSQKASEKKKKIPPEGVMASKKKKGEVNKVRSPWFPDLDPRGKKKKGHWGMGDFSEARPPGLLGDAAKLY